MQTTVLYVHGLWMTGIEGGLLRHRLARLLNADAPTFAYPTVRTGIEGNAARLASFMESVCTETLHLVGHSLGGLIIYEALGMLDASRLPPGRVVLLGSPMAGSRAAERLNSWRLGRMLAGRTVSETLIGASERRWRYSDRELGVIAGTLNMGIGRLVNRHIAPSDGTVYVDETRVAGATDTLELRVSHAGLPFSANVARHTAQFLRTGRFSD